MKRRSSKAMMAAGLNAPVDYYIVRLYPGHVIHWLSVKKDGIAWRLRRAPSIKKLNSSKVLVQEIKQFRIEPTRWTGADVDIPRRHFEVEEI